MAREFRISHAEIELHGLGNYEPAFFKSALLRSWVPGTEVTRYTRTWKLSASVEHDDGLLSGHMGFIKEGDIATVAWDDETKDFVRGEASSGVVVPFVVNVEKQLVSFQLFPGEVRQKTVTSNLQALLNVEGTHRWVIRPFWLPRSFEEWLSSVNRVSSFYVRLDIPNPSWTGREKVEGLVEGLGASTVSMTAKAGEDGSINTGSDWFRQAMDHVRRGYGRADVSGSEKDTGAFTHFQQTPDGGSVPVVDRVPVEEDTDEVAIDDLGAAQARLIESHPGDIVAVDADEGPDDDPQS